MSNNSIICEFSEGLPLTNKEREECYRKATKLVNDTLPILARLLGELHSIDNTVKFWEPVVGIWLRCFALLYVEKASGKEGFFDDAKSLVSEVEVEEYCSAPFGWEGFNARYQKPEFHNAISLQIRCLNNDCDKILSFGSSCEMQKGWCFPKPLITANTLSGTIGSSLKKICAAGRYTSLGFYWRRLCAGFWSLLFSVTKTLGFYISAAVHRKKLVVISTNVLDRESILRFYLQSLGQIVCYPTLLSSKTTLLISKLLRTSSDDGKRTQLADLVSKIEDSDRVFWKLLLQQLPRVHVEEFRVIYGLAKLTFVKSPMCVYTDGQQYVDEVLKVAMGRWLSNGAKLLVAQHGGNDGTASWDSYFDQDAATSSIYYTWGWKAKNGFLKPMPSMRISLAKVRVNNYRADLGKGHILYVCRAVYSVQMGMLAYTLADGQIVKNGRKRLIDNLSESLKKKILIRYRASDLSVNKAETIREFEGAGFIIAPQNASIASLFQKSELIIFESISTGFFECLAVDKPAVLFLSENYIPFEGSVAKQLLALLERAGVIFRDARFLASFLSGNISEWWFAEKRKLARSQLKHQFALTSDSFVKEWVQEFRTGVSV